jgi:hypothetical protein
VVVTGSNPVVPTNIKKAPFFGAFLVLAGWEDWFVSGMFYVPRTGSQNCLEQF